MCTVVVLVLVVLAVLFVLFVLALDGNIRLYAGFMGKFCNARSPAIARPPRKFPRWIAEKYLEAIKEETKLPFQLERDDQGWLIWYRPPKEWTTKDVIDSLPPYLAALYDKE